jgi:uncharacterized phage-associated protein
MRGKGKRGKSMADVHDVAKYILKRTGEITTWKLQKLVYYSQAWSLVWDEKPLFKERIEAWANGPVVPALYRVHKGEFEVSNWPYGDSRKLTQEQKDTINAVIKFYGPKPSQWLSDLTHRETPWRRAREGLSPTASSNEEITIASMAEYYSGLKH